jgi:radical SAM superfamily enzyme YgiQ (UPF0313 family)
MSASRSRGRVLLYFPRVVPPGHPAGAALHFPPLSYLALGGPLREAGFDVRILDARLGPHTRAEIEATIGQAVCLAVTCLTGYAVTDGLEMAAVAKRLRPDLPVVWGGWHPSFVAKQALHDPRVDIVVRGQGQRSFVEVLEALIEKRSLEGILGISYRDGSRTVETPDRPTEDINAFPPPAYDLIDVDRYIVRGPGAARHFSTIFSRGCPYHCDFCLDSRQKWFGLGLERMRDELDLLVGRYGVTDLRLYDGNFFMGRERLQEFGRMIAGGALRDRFRWSATAVARRVVQLDGNVWSLLRRAGCEQLAIGAESGSDELLQQITNKTTVEQTIEAVRLLTRHGINQYLFFMVGYPEEPAEALHETLSLAARLKAINPKLGLQMSFCIPLPGSRMFRIAVEKGLFVEPREFADWGAFDYDQPNLPHISDEYERRVHHFLSYLQLAYPAQPHSGGLRRMLLDPVRRTARWRLDHVDFRVPLEATLLNTFRHVRRRLIRTPISERPRATGLARVT